MSKPTYDDFIKDQDKQMKYALIILVIVLVLVLVPLTIMWWSEL